MSVCLSQPRRAASLGYRHAGCLQLSHVRTADPSADGCRSAASRTIELPSAGTYRLAAPGAITCLSYVCIKYYGNGGHSPRKDRKDVLSGVHTYGALRALVKRQETPSPVDRFCRSIRHMTCFRARMWLWGVPFVATPHLRNHVPKTPFWGCE